MSSISTHLIQCGATSHYYLWRIFLGTLGVLATLLLPASWLVLGGGDTNTCITPPLEDLIIKDFSHLYIIVIGVSQTLIKHSSIEYFSICGTFSCTLSP